MARPLSAPFIPELLDKSLGSRLFVLVVFQPGEHTAGCTREVPGNSRHFTPPVGDAVPLYCPGGATKCKLYSQEPEQGTSG